jgi:hypothetical protein
MLTDNPQSPGRDIPQNRRALHLGFLGADLLALWDQIAGLHPAVQSVVQELPHADHG